MVKRTRVSEAGFEFRMPIVPREHVRFIEEHEYDLKIDENGLEEALQSQVTSYYEVSKQLSLEVSRRDAAKQYLKQIESRVDAEIRRKAKTDGDKITEVVVEARRIASEDVIEATNILLDAESRVRDITALKDAFSQRSYVLKDMVSLWISNYYGGSEDERANKSVRSMNAEATKRATRERTRR